MKKVLCIDGGGMRGFIPASLLVELERRSGRRCCELFDDIWGTSIGGIVGELLAAGVPAVEALKFFTEDGPRIFRKTLRSRASLDGILWPKYPAAPIEAVLQKRFQNLELHTHVGVTAYDLVKQVPYFFKFAPYVHHCTELWQAARATSSAQLYFPAFEVLLADARHVFWDGGNVANNPSVCAFAEASRHGNRTLMLSLGCGAPRPVYGRKALAAAQALVNTNGVRNGVATVTTLFAAGSEDVDYQMTQFLGGNYHRIQPVLDTELPLDDASPAGLRALRDAAANAVRDYGHRLDKFLARL